MGNDLADLPDDQQELLRSLQQSARDFGTDPVLSRSIGTSIRDHLSPERHAAVIEHLSAYVPAPGQEAFRERMRRILDSGE